jgi:L-2,4-diaminobutyrate transaminase
VVTGFGRLGTMMGSDHYGIEPDIITIAKGLTSAYAPLSGSIVSEEVWKVLEEGTDSSALRPWLDLFGPSDRRGGRHCQPAADRRAGAGANARDTGAYFNRRWREALADHPMSARCAAKAC